MSLKQIQVKPKVNRLINFLTSIEQGEIKIPTFQRDFIWINKQKIELLDSISKEYPIGSILLWKPKERFKYKNDIGPYIIEKTAGNDVFYILDGFQRLSTLFGCLTNPSKTKLQLNTKLRKEFTICYDLDEEVFNMNSISLTNWPVYILVDTYEFLDYCDRLRIELNDNEKAKKFIERAKKVSSTLIDYEIPSVEIIGGLINEAVDIFSRINSKGKPISQDWMLSALTSNERDNFNLGDILGNLKKELKQYNFESIKRDILVQCIQNSFGKIYFDQKIEELAKRKNFKYVTNNTVESIRRAIKFLFEELLVIDRRLLPYNSQLIFLSHFFNEIQNPTQVQLKKLKDWFWVSSYSNYFTIYSLSKIRNAFSEFKKFVKDENYDPIYYDQSIDRFIIAELPKTVSFKSVRSTSFLLFLLNYSNNFNKIDSEDIDSFELNYLFKNFKIHSGVFPVMKYVNQTSHSLPFPYSKPKEMAYLFELNNFSSFANNYFLNEEIRHLYEQKKYNLAIEKRMQLIKSAESQFVEKYKIIYNDPFLLI